MRFVLKCKSGQPLSGFVDEGRRKNEPALRPLLQPVSLQFGLANLVCLLFIACETSALFLLSPLKVQHALHSTSLYPLSQPKNLDITCGSGQNFGILVEVSRQFSGEKAALTTFSRPF